MKKIYLIQIYFIIVFVFSSASDIQAVEAIKIIERANVTKQMKVEKILEKEDRRLKNYYSFSLRFKGMLIFCHISKDNTQPKTICY